ncbi:hypothetical protein [Paludibaculum fermentans]|uniref:hypothetical protein n=1 Tax=Paludibaculum fermentans TaxID=1473598 RepID=UPI003EBF62EA
MLNFRKYSFFLMMSMPGVYCALNIAGGLREGFTHDDLMNLYRGVFRAWPQLLLDCVMIWRPTEVVRPLGEMTYKLLWGAFHFEPFPYRAACLSLVVVNSMLCFVVVRKLLGHDLAALAAAWVLAYHGSFWGMYCNTGVIFDIQVITLFFSALLVTAWQPAGWAGHCVRLVVLLVLVIAALNTKEIAVSLAAAIGALCWLERFTPVKLVETAPERTTWNLACFLVAAGATAVFVFGRVLGQGGLEENPAYHVTASAALVGSNAAKFFSDLLYDRISWTPLAAGAVYLAGLAVVVGLRWVRECVFLLLAAISFLPMAVIPSRGLDASYLAVFWLIATLAGVLGRGLKRWPIFRWVPVVVVVAVTAIALTLGRTTFPQFGEESRPIAKAYAGIRAGLRGLPEQGALAIVEDPFAEHSPWGTTFMALLATERSDFSVARPEDLAAAEANPAAKRAFDVVLLVTMEYAVLRCAGPDGRRMTLEGLRQKEYPCQPVSGSGQAP